MEGMGGGGGGGGENTDTHTGCLKNIFKKRLKEMGGGVGGG